MTMRRVMMANLIGTNHRFRPEGYRVLHNRQGPWLRRFLIRKMWQWLHNNGALQPYEAEFTTYEYNEIKRERLSDTIRESVDEVLYGIARDPTKGPNDYAICVGGAQFHEIMGGFIADRHTVVDGGDWWLDSVRDAGSRDVVKIKGMPVHVIPSMDGVAVIPRVVVEKRPGERNPLGDGRGDVSRHYGLPNNRGFT